MVHDLKKCKNKVKGREPPRSLPTMNTPPNLVSPANTWGRAS
jgi:hypothetical protein